MSARADVLLLVGVVAGEALFAAHYALRATHWSVMTDELQNARLAMSVARTGVPLPVVHGQYYGVWSMLYPLLLAPFYAALSAPAAVTGAHFFNAVAMVSTAWPVYLLARSVTGSRTGGWVAAALTGLVPWLTLTTALLTENVAYPAFAWAVLAMHRALAAPSDRRGVVALGALALAMLARTQFFLLAVVLPIAVIAHEAGSAASGAAAGERASAAARAMRGALASQRVLLGASLAGALLAGALAAVGRLGSVLGNYSSTLSGGILPPGVWRAAADHLDRIVVGIGIVPFVLAAAWSFGALAAPRTRQAHAFAVLFVLLVPLLSIQTASFDIRFTPGGFPQERYLFYVAPLLFVGMVACLVEDRRPGTRAVLVVVAGLLFVGLAALGSFEPTTPIFWASPASTFDSVIGRAAGWFGLGADTFVLLVGIVASLVLAAAIWRGQALRALGVVAVTVAALTFYETRHVLEVHALPAVARRSVLRHAPRDWIDNAVPSGASVAVVPQTYWGPDPWWDAEFWNKTVDRAVKLGRGPTYSPFPFNYLRTDFRTGRFVGAQPTRLLVVAIYDPRFHIANATAVALSPPLVLIRTGKHVRADYLTRNLFVDGWMRAGRTARLRFYGVGRRRQLHVSLTLSASLSARHAQRYYLSAPKAKPRFAGVAPGTTVSASFRVVAPAHGFSEARLRVVGRAHLPDGRRVGLHLDRVDVRPARSA